MLVDTKDVVRVDTTETGGLQWSQIILTCGCSVTLRADGICVAQVICSLHVARDLGARHPTPIVRRLTQELATR